MFWGLSVLNACGHILVAGAPRGGSAELVAGIPCEWEAPPRDAGMLVVLHMISEVETGQQREPLTEWKALSAVRVGMAPCWLTVGQPGAKDKELNGAEQGGGRPEEQQIDGMHLKNEIESEPSGRNPQDKVPDRQISAHEGLKPRHGISAFAVVMVGVERGSGMRVVLMVGGAQVPEGEHRKAEGADPADGSVHPGRAADRAMDGVVGGDEQPGAQEYLQGKGHQHPGTQLLWGRAKQGGQVDGPGGVHHQCHGQTYPGRCVAGGVTTRMGADGRCMLWAHGAPPVQGADGGVDSTDTLPSA